MKDGRCVEKWGPGPLGAGTACDKCRKQSRRKEKFEERRAREDQLLADRYKQLNGLDNVADNVASKVAIEDEIDRDVAMISGIRSPGSSTSSHPTPPRNKRKELDVEDDLLEAIGASDDDIRMKRERS